MSIRNDFFKLVNVDSIERGAKGRALQGQEFTASDFGPRPLIALFGLVQGTFAGVTAARWNCLRSADSMLLAPEVQVLQAARPQGGRSGVSDRRKWFYRRVAVVPAGLPAAADGQRRSQNEC